MEVKLQVVNQDAQIKEAAEAYFAALDNEEEKQLTAKLKQLSAARQTALAKLTLVFQPNQPTTVVVGNRAIFRQSPSSALFISTIRSLDTKE